MKSFSSTYLFFCLTYGSLVLLVLLSPSPTLGLRLKQTTPEVIFQVPRSDLYHCLHLDTDNHGQNLTKELNIEYYWYLDSKTNTLSSYLYVKYFSKGWMGVVTPSENSTHLIMQAGHSNHMGSVAELQVTDVEDLSFDSSAIVNYYNKTNQSKEYQFKRNGKYIEYWYLKTKTSLPKYINSTTKAIIVALGLDTEDNSNATYTFTIDLDRNSLQNRAFQSCSLNSAGFFMFTTRERLHYIVPLSIARFTTILYGVVVFILLIVFHYRKTVRSRYLTPYISCASYFIYEALVMSFELAGNHILFFVIGFTVAILSFSVYCLQVLRYFYIRNLYRTISKHERLTGQSDSSRVISFHRKVASKATYLLLFCMIMAVVICECVLVTTLVMTNKMTVETGRSIVSLVSLGVVIVVTVISLGGLVLDMAFHYKLIFKHGRVREFFGSYDDPLLYRSEFIIIPVTLLFGALAVIFRSVLWPKTLHSGNWNLYLFYCYAYSISLFIYSICAQLNFGGFISAIELYRTIKILVLKKNSNTSKANSNSDDAVDGNQYLTVVQFLKNEQSMKFMEQYCRKEFSIENLHLYKTINEIQKKPNTISRLEFKALFDKYLARGSVMEVNISGEIYKTCKDFVETSDADGESDVKDILFILQHAIIENLNDSFSRLNKTREYDKHVQQLNVQKELLMTTFTLT